MGPQEIVLEVIAQVSGVDRQKITPDSALVGDLGIDSPKTLQMLVELEDRLEMEIDDELVTRLDTVADILRAIDHRS